MENTQTDSTSDIVINLENLQKFSRFKEKLDLLIFSDKGKSFLPAPREELNTNRWEFSDIHEDTITIKARGYKILNLTD